MSDIGTEERCRAKSRARDWIYRSGPVRVDSRSGTDVCRGCVSVPNASDTCQLGRVATIDPYVGREIPSIPATEGEGARECLAITTATGSIAAPTQRAHGPLSTQIVDLTRDHRRR
jgi:hypothetical protein